VATPRSTPRSTQQVPRGASGCARRRWPIVPASSSPASGWTTIPGWRLLEPGELVHVDGDLNVTSRIDLGDPPAHLIRLEDPDPRTATAAMAAEPELARRKAATAAHGRGVELERRSTPASN
jgi:hypothetical protein